jgi:hypothetical protein
LFNCITSQVAKPLIFPEFQLTPKRDACMIIKELNDIWSMVNSEGLVMAREVQDSAWVEDPPYIIPAFHLSTIPAPRPNCAKQSQFPAGKIDANCRSKKGLEETQADHAAAKTKPICGLAVCRQGVSRETPHGPRFRGGRLTTSEPCCAKQSQFAAGKINAKYCL